MSRTVSVIVPVKNERGTISRIIEEIPEMGNGTEIIFVEGGSTDGTYDEIVKQVKSRPDRNIKLIKQEGKGKANAVEMGFNAALGDVLMILDGDLTVSPADLLLFYDKARSGVLVVGSRMLEMNPKDNTMRLLNLLANRFFARLVSWICGQRVADGLCGCKTLMRTDWNKIHMLSQDKYGDFSLIFGAAGNGIEIINVPVVYHSRQYGKTQIHRFRGGLSLLWVCLAAYWRFKVNNLDGKYNNR